MNNAPVFESLVDCRSELQVIKSFLIGLGRESNPYEYMNRYAVIRASGTIETGFKTIIADRVDEGSHAQVRAFIKRKIRDSSANPKLGVIENMLSEFDDRWRTRFDELMAFEDKLGVQSSLKKLVDARNSFAHGGSTNLELDETIKCFEHGVLVLEILDRIVNETGAE